MSLRIDLHVHTQSFGRIFMTPDRLRRAFRDRSLDGIAVTNFFNLTHALWLKKQLPEFVIIPGQEVWTHAGHVIALGIHEKVPDFQPAEQTVHRIHEQGGLAVAVHPYLHMGLRSQTRNVPVDLIETYNAAIGSIGIYNFLARRLAADMGKPMIAATDTTDCRFLGQSYTEVLTDDPEEVLSNLKDGNFVTCCRPLPVPVSFILKGLIKQRDLEPCPLHATVCFVCAKTMAVGLFRKRYRCTDCDKEEISRISCCNGHYFCRACVARRIHALDRSERYEQEPAFGEVRA